MRQDHILLTESRAAKIVTAVQEALTSFIGAEVDGKQAGRISSEPSDSLFVDLEQDEAQIFVHSLQKKLAEIVGSEKFYRETSHLADYIVGSTYALLLSLSGRSELTVFTLDNAAKAAQVERHMQAVRSRIHELLRVP